MSYSILGQERSWGRADLFSAKSVFVNETLALLG